MRLLDEIDNDYFQQKVRLEMTLAEFLELVVGYGSTARNDCKDACDNWMFRNDTLNPDLFMSTIAVDTKLFENCIKILEQFDIRLAYLSSTSNQHLANE